MADFDFPHVQTSSVWHTPENQNTPKTPTPDRWVDFYYSISPSTFQPRNFCNVSRNHANLFFTKNGYNKGIENENQAELERKEETVMEMTLRWYGSKFDTVTLQQIRQIPGVTGVITTLYDTAPGDVWSRERIRELKEEVEAAGLHIAGIESVNVHDAIKTGSEDRDKYIDNYIETLKNLGQEDIHLVCYNFMPVFDWTRTELARVRPDGSTVLAYTCLLYTSTHPPRPGR